MYHTKQHIDSYNYFAFFCRQKNATHDCWWPGSSSCYVHISCGVITHLVRVKHIAIWWLNHHSFSLWLVASSATSHYLTLCPLLVKLQEQISVTFESKCKMQAFKNAICLCLNVLGLVIVYTRVLPLPCSLAASLTGSRPCRAHTLCQR